jgi:polyisoprenoid-binding protein YceI
MLASLQKRMQTWALVCSFVSVSAVADAEIMRYDIDPEHTTLGFSAVHMLVRTSGVSSGSFPDLSRWIPRPRW